MRSPSGAVPPGWIRSIWNGGLCPLIEISPACANEWLPGICRKPATRCAECDQRQFLPVTDQVIYDHLAGKHTVGVYPQLPDDSCWFLAADFDRADWRQGAAAFMQTCADLDVPAVLEVSRSGAGAHSWIFFAETIPARHARRLGTALISRTCSRSVAGAALIARRPVSTLVLVHRMELLKQWRERLGALLELPEGGGLGVIGGRIRKPSAQFDIAVMQSLSRWEGLPELIGPGELARKLATPPPPTARLWVRIPPRTRVGRDLGQVGAGLAQKTSHAPPVMAGITSNRPSEEAA